MVLGGVIGAFTMTLLHGCKPERIEYHRRPAIYERASDQPPQDEVVLEDGTIIRYRTAVRPGIVGEGGSDGSKPFQIREEAEDGTITLRALLPEHVLMNALACMRNREYLLMWEQLLSPATREEFENLENGFDGFATFMEKNRHELVSSLTRMVTGIPSHETSITRLSAGVTRCRLRPQVAEGFKFRVVDVVQENGSYLLLQIQ